MSAKREQSAQPAICSARIQSCDRKMKQAVLSAKGRESQNVSL